MGRCRPHRVDGSPQPRGSRPSQLYNFCMLAVLPLCSSFARGLGPTQRERRESAPKHGRHVMEAMPRVGHDRRSPLQSWPGVARPKVALCKRGDSPRHGAAAWPSPAPKVALPGRRWWGWWWSKGPRARAQGFPRGNPSGPTLGSPPRRRQRRVHSRAQKIYDFCRKSMIFIKIYDFHRKSIIFIEHVWFS